MISRTKQLDPSELIYGLPQIVIENTMGRMGCFRTEVRDTGIFICGVHMSGANWKKAETDCPDAIEAGYIAAEGLLTLVNEFELLNEDDPFRHALLSP